MASVSTSGVFATITPLRVAAAMSTLSTPAEYTDTPRKRLFFRTVSVSLSRSCATSTS